MLCKHLRYKSLIKGKVISLSAFYMRPKRSYLFCVRVHVGTCVHVCLITSEKKRQPSTGVFVTISALLLTFGMSLVFFEHSLF